MGYFQVRYDSRGVNYDRRGFIRLATGVGDQTVPMSAFGTMKCLIIAKRHRAY